MKKAIISGVISGLGFFLTIMAGSKHPEISWTDLALIVGFSLITMGACGLNDILKETV